MTPDLTEEDWRLRIEGVAAHAVTAAEMGSRDDQITSEIIGLTEGSGVVVTPGFLRAVGQAITAMPQPVDTPPDKRESLQFFERMLGVATAEEQLNAALRALGIVNALAARLEAP